MICPFKTQLNHTRIFLRDFGMEEKTEIRVRCDDEWHIREPYIKYVHVNGEVVERHIPQTVVCLCPEYNEVIAKYIKSEFNTDGWCHVSLKNRRAG